MNAAKEPKRLSSPKALASALILLSIAGCSFLRPSEVAMQTAISNYVLQEKDYPREYILPENFEFSNLQKVENSDPTQYQVQASFDFTYKADGDVIVQTLKEKHIKEREQTKRLTNNPFEQLKGALTGALESFGYEKRFENVRTGDQDHFSGIFTLMRNEDNSWRVSDASY
jgi:hypothetical protein